MQDVPTRWGSTLLMITRLLKHKENVLAVLDETPSHKLTLLTENDWARLRGLAAILEPLEQASVQLGGEKYSSCGVVLPLLSHLLSTMGPNDDDAGYISRFKSMFYADMVTRRDSLKSKCFLLCSTALDPRFKSLKFLARNERSAV